MRPAKVFLCQSLGFLAIILVCFLDELVNLSALVFRDHAYILEFRSSALKMLLILCVWLLVSGSTRRILLRAERLERFMKVCAWCRRIEHNGRWLPLEQFFKLGLDTPTSHGICQECVAKAAEEIAAVAGTGKPKI